MEAQPGRLRWARIVTPLLHVGPGEMKMPHVVVESAAEAAELMDKATVVVVPDDDVAREVLRHYGADEDHINLRIAMSYPTLTALPQAPAQAHTSEAKKA